MTANSNRWITPLLALALAIVWLEGLCSQGLTGVTLVALPPLIGLGWFLRNSTKPGWLGWLTACLLAIWFVGFPLADRGQWLASFSNLLALMTGLKLLEAESPRGIRLVCLLLLVDTGLAGVVGQSLAASLALAVVAFLSLGALLALEAGPQPLKELLKRCLLLLLISLPVVITSFVLLPRMPALVSMEHPGTATSGLNDQLRPGSIAALAQSDALAARILFSNQRPPPPTKRYWRVLVHHRFDGEGWSYGRLPLATLGNPQTPAFPEQSFNQRWLVEPSGLQWRPWGGGGLPSDPNLQITSDGTLWQEDPQLSRQRYVISDIGGPAAWLNLPPAEDDRILPRGQNPRLEALGRSWAALSPTAEGRLTLAEQWFRNQPFTYTTEPGTLPPQAPWDSFLFEQQTGFCEHFAASFTALMRAAEVPARVVVGYQGGSWQQPLASEPYLTLRQSDAHAWSEVWLEGQGWVEVDPTHWVPPQRDHRHRTKPGLFWLDGITNQWQGLDTRWQLWVMQFDSKNQKRLVESWLHHQSQWQALIAVMMIGLCLVVGLLVLIALDRSTPRDQSKQALDRSLKALSSMGLKPKPGESLATFCRRAGSQQPKLVNLLVQIAAHYDALRFGPIGSVLETKKQRHDLETVNFQLMKQIRQFQRSLRQPGGYARKSKS